MQGIVWHVPHWDWRLMDMIPNGTLSGCYPTLPKIVNQCKLLQGLCAMPKWVLANMTPLLQCTMKKTFPSTNNMEHGFWFCHDDIKGCVSGNQNDYVMDWPIVPKTWLLKINI